MLRFKLVRSALSSASNYTPLSWLLWCASLLLLLTGWALRVAPGAYFASGCEPAATAAELRRSDERGIGNREASVELEQRAVLATPKLKRQSTPKRLLDALGARSAPWGDWVKMGEFESPLSAAPIRKRLAPIRKRVPRMGTDEPPWFGSRSIS